MKKKIRVKNPINATLTAALKRIQGNLVQPLCDRPECTNSHDRVASVKIVLAVVEGINLTGPVLLCFCSKEHMQEALPLFGLNFQV